MGAALALVLYAGFQPVFVLAPLAVLLLASGPTSRREWWWIFLCLAWLGYTSLAVSGLVDETVLAGGILVGGAFFAMMIRRPRPAFEVALWALLLGGAALLFWGAWLGIGWRDIKLAVFREGWALVRGVENPDPTTMAVDSSATLKLYTDALSRGIGPMATLFPALMALTAVGGMVLAWNWYHRVSLRPLGAPLARLAEFTFSDHLVWGVVLGLAALVLPLPAEVQEAGGNLVLFFGGLFVIRGLAVVRTWIRQTPGPLLGLMAFSLLFIWPVAAGGLLSLGLADAWLDFRRRLTPPTVEG
ncbi:MAG TPA: hypothetical protein VJN95_17305 [Gemmatimonadales bacterium]|nr:hypothetical protein [Gemmatimonadales bacterium]